MNFNVRRVHTRGFWQFRFHGDHFNHDSQNFFQASRDSRALKMVDHGVTKINLPPPPLYTYDFRRLCFSHFIARYCDGCPMSSNFGWDELSWRRPIPKGLFIRREGYPCARVTQACKRGLKLALVYKQISQVGLPYHPGQLYQLFWRVSSCATFFVTVLYGKHVKFKKKETENFISVDRK